jgi:hypothetical protein
VGFKNSATLTARLLTDPVFTPFKDGSGEWVRVRVIFWNSGPKPGLTSLVSSSPGVVEKFRSLALTKGCMIEARGELDFSEWSDRQGNGRSEVRIRVLDIELEARPTIATRTTKPATSR